MSTFQGSRRSTQRRRLLATGVLSLIVALSSYVEHALAAACTGADTYYTGSGDANSCVACPTGTGATAPGGSPSARTYCPKIKANYYGTAGSASADADVTACPSATVSGSAFTTVRASDVTSDKGRETCSHADKPSNAEVAAMVGAHGEAIGFWTVAGNSDNNYYVCPEGTKMTGAAAPADASANTFCASIEVGYWGTQGVATGSSGAHAKRTGGGANDRPTKCTTTFSGATAAGITSASSATTTDKSDCVTAAGYIITSAAGAADGAITVGLTPAGTKAAGGTALTTHATNANTGTGAETGTACPSGKSSDGGLAFCGKVAAGYFGTVGAKTSGVFTADAGTVALCTSVFTHASAAATGAITSDESATTTTKTACKTGAGYIITSAAGAADAAITVAPAPSGTYAAGGTLLLDSGSGRAAETATACPYGGTTTFTGHALAGCSPQCGSGTNAEANAGTCRCAANFYGTPQDANGLTVGTVTQGCTACPTGYTAAAGSATVQTCAGTCAANTFEDDSDASNGCKVCPAGTTTDTVPTGGTQSRCEKIAAGYYGTAGTRTGGSKAHASSLTACPYGGTSTKSAANNAVTDCTPQCGSGTNAEVNAGTCRCAANYYGTPQDANNAALAIVTQGCTACPNSGTSAAGTTAIESCAVPCAVNTFEDDGTANNGCKVCPAGTTTDTVPTGGIQSRCEKIAAGYYGTAGTRTGSSKAHASSLTACTTTFSGATAAGITSDASGTTTTKTACKTQPGYIITSADGAADATITVAQAPVGTYHAGETPLLAGDGAGTAAETATNCPTGRTSAAGSNAVSGCVNCAAGKTSAGGACTNCAAGTTSVVGGACTNCAAGTYSIAGGNYCTNCAAGTYSAAGASACTNCPAGKTSVAGAASCTDCPAGSTSVAGANSCASTSSDDHAGHDHTSATPSLPMATGIAISAALLLLI